MGLQDAGEIVRPKQPPRNTVEENKVSITVKMGQLANDDSKQYREYEVNFVTWSIRGNEVESKSQTWNLRYSQLEQSEARLPAILHGFVPPKRPLRNFKTDETNCHRRAAEIEQYLQFLFSHTEVLTTKHYQRAIGLKNADFLDTLAEIGHAYYKQAELNKFELEQSWKPCYDLSQSFFDKGGDETQVSILAFTELITFRIFVDSSTVLDSRFLGIEGPDGKQWFGVERCPDSIAVYYLTTMADRRIFQISPQLLQLQLGRSCEISRVGAFGILEWCTIEKIPGILQAPIFTVQPTNPHCGPVKIDCSLGSFANVYYQNGNIAASVNRNITNLGGVLGNAYYVDVTIYPGTDALLFLSLVLSGEIMRRTRYE